MVNAALRHRQTWQVISNNLSVFLAHLHFHYYLGNHGQVLVFGEKHLECLDLSLNDLPMATQLEWTILEFGWHLFIIFLFLPLGSLFGSV